MSAIREDATTFANQCIQFHLVGDSSALVKTDGLLSFHPEYTHQHFGMSEKIFGYLKPKVDIYCAQATLDLCVQFTYEKEFKKDELNNLNPDNVVKILTADMPKESLHSTLDSFGSALVKGEAFQPMGTLFHRYTRSSANGHSEEQFEIYFINSKDVQFRRFIPYFLRLQTFMLFFVDGASLIDEDDQQWNYFILYKKITLPCSSVRYCIAGYMTAFQFYAYPEHIRPRLSQMLILPPFQRRGHGTEMMRVFYNWVNTLNNVVDCTVEDPNVEFQKMRDKLDCMNVIQDAELSGEQGLFDRKRLLVSNFSKRHFSALHTKFHLNRRQALRVFDILKLRSILTDNAIFMVKRTQQFHDILMQRMLNQNMIVHARRQMFEDLQREHFENEAVKAAKEIAEDYKAVVDSIDPILNT